MNDRKIFIEIKTLDNYIMRRAMSEGKKLGIIPPSPIQVRTIVYLIEHSNKDVYQKDLEKEFNLRRSTISGILKTMEKHNIITKINADNDARSRKIKLSKEADRKYKSLMDNFKTLDMILREDISDYELEIFFNVIDKMKENMLGD